MRTIILNDDNILDRDIDYDVVRVKGLIINSKGEIILVRNNDTYQFPGGHRKKDEQLFDTLGRELKEELGAEYKIGAVPFLLLTTYDSNYFDTGSKVLSKIYYYIIYSDVEPDENNLNLDKMEKASEFNIFKIDVKDLVPFLNKALEDGKIEKNIGREMLIAANEFNDYSMEVI